MTTKYESGGITVSIGKSQTVQLALRIFRVRLTGLLFETDKTFLLPIAMHGIRGLVEYYQNHPNAKLVVTGHTDTVGDAAYNLALSNERAASVGHFLKDEVDPWLACYQGSPHSKTWGTREDQHMLTAIKDDAGQPFYAGPVHGQLDEPTRDAVTRYQTARGLAVDGQPGLDTRRSLCTDYMQLDETTLPATASLEALGCGENHPEVPTPDGTDEPANRRVEIFLFDGSPEPPNPGTCPGGGCAYPEWKQRAEEIVDFDHDLCELLVQCHDDDAQPLENALVRLTREAGDERDLPTNSQGQAFFQNLLAGQYQVRGEKKGFSTEVRTVQVVSGGVAQDSDQAVVAKKSFAGDEGGVGTPFNPSTSGNPPVNLQLDKEMAIIHVVGELPANLTEAVKEGAANQLHAGPWQRVEGTLQSGAGDEELRFDVNGKAFPFIEQPPAKLARLHVRKPHRLPVDYRIWDKAGKTVLTEPNVEPGTTLEVQISTRVRMSVWCFGAPFMNDPHSFNVDSKQLALLAAARIDDVSMVDTICAKESNWTDGGGGTDVAWTGRLRPGGVASGDPRLEDVRDTYIKNLVAGLRANKVQLILGYTIGNEGHSKPKPGEEPAASDTYCKGFTDWLRAASPDVIREHARAIAAFVEKYDAAGIGFDLEITSLGDAHRANLALLYREVSDQLAPRNGIVSYATAPFTEEGKVDGIPCLSGIQAQPFSLARDIPNLIARPMCYDTLPFKFETIGRSVDYAVGAAGLDPAQIQYGIYGHAPGKGAGAAIDFCSNKLRPNRIGMVWYQVSQASSVATTTLTGDCKNAEAALNAGEAPQGTEGQPLQVPRAAP